MSGGRTRLDALRARLAAKIAPDGRRSGQPIFLDYPVDPEPRYGYGRRAHPEIDHLIGLGHDRYETQLRSFGAHVDALAKIPLSGDGTLQPYWDNTWFTGLDAVALYGFLGERDPLTYLEVGSGLSTMFARRAISDLGLRTRIVSVDPQPRAEINTLCDQVMRQPLESVDVDALVGTVEPGDVVFIDGSHRTFQNSDATVAFLELIPRLPAGVLVGVHDIFLPWDYPPGMQDAMYSEQYLLAAWLLAMGGRIRIVLPDFYVCLHPDLHRVLAQLWDRLVWAAAPTNGTAFWFERTGGS